MVLKHDEVRSDNDDSSAVEAECGALIKYKKVGKYLLEIAEVSPETGEELRVIERGRLYDVFE